jgi:general secretion pathway protein G
MRNAPIRAKEAVLKEDLFTMRSCIDQYLADKGEYPPELQTLVDEGYLRFIPIEPISGSDEVWAVVRSDPDEDEDLEPIEGGGGIIDVYANIEEIALDGTPYKEW